MNALKRQDISETQILNPIYDYDTRFDTEISNLDDHNISRNKSFGQNKTQKRSPFR